MHFHKIRVKKNMIWQSSKIVLSNWNILIQVFKIVLIYNFCSQCYIQYPIKQALRHTLKWKLAPTEFEWLLVFPQIILKCWCLKSFLQIAVFLWVLSKVLTQYHPVIQRLIIKFHTKLISVMWQQFEGHNNLWRSISWCMVQSFCYTQGWTWRFAADYFNQELTCE